jgi:hypothetical protein
MRKGQKQQRKPSKQQSDLRSSWAVVGKKIGRAIQEGAKADEVRYQSERRTISRDHTMKRMAPADVSTGRR